MKITRSNNIYRYISEHRKYFFCVIVLYATAFALALFLPQAFTFFNAPLSEIGEKIAPLSNVDFAFYILYNNLSNSLMTIISGLFFGIVPLVNSFLNGAIFGYVSASTYNFTASFSRTFFSFAPHAIFELPATFLSLGLGFKFGFRFVRNYIEFYKNDSRMKIFGILLFLLSLIMVSYLFYLSNLRFISSFQLSFYSLLMFIPLFILFIFNPRIAKIQKKGFYNELRYAVVVFLTVILPLFVIGAIIEGIVFSMTRA